MTLLSRRPAALAAGIASLMMGAASWWAMSAHPGPQGEVRFGQYGLTVKYGPTLLLALAYLLIAAGMLLSLRTRRPRTAPAWAVWVFALVTVVLSSQLPALWIAQRLEVLTGLTDQDGPMWQAWPIVCLVLAALLSQIVGQEDDRPALTVAGLICAFVLSLRLAASLVGDGLLRALPWVVGLLLVGYAVFAPAGRGRAGPGGGAVPRSWTVVGAALLAGAGSMIVAQLIRWHACLGWRWGSDRTCGTSQDHRYDYVFPDSPPALPGAAALHGIGLLLVAAALVSALVIVARHPPASPWGRVLLVGTGVLWALAVVVVAMPGVAGIAPSWKVTDGMSALTGSGLDPLLFMVLAGLVAVSGLEHSRRLPLVRLFAGLALSTFFVEFSFWSGVYASYDTPPFSGLLRALVVLAVGTQLIRMARPSVARNPATRADEFRDSR
ncbi:hypothetical protein [Pseudonocardia spinosispora]|uniref:hypothetical protein n=1 Tax=Pseudonocardia spinosispora TaxID=103441 RepID=UPI00048D78E7|nr:hypothetical protein [Pseudonocardia spinosispora]